MSTPNGSSSIPSLSKWSRVSASELVAWAAVVAVPLSASAGWMLRRWGRGRFVIRMRPHFVLGYAALGIAAIHIALVMGRMGGANPKGIWFATLAFAGLGLQAFLGTNLQSPGAYRAPLRRWHVILFWTIGLLVTGHVLLN